MSENLCRIKTGVETAQLIAELEKHPELWDQITDRQEFPGTYHAHTKAIFLRWAEDRSVKAGFNELAAIDYPAISFLPSVRPLIAAVVESVQATAIGRVMVVDLRPGGYIPRHSDEGAYADHYERFHLVIESDEGNEFFVEKSRDPKIDELAHMQSGELWYFNHKQPHYVFNGSRKRRIHLIVDAVAPAYRKERQQ